MQSRDRAAMGLSLVAFLAAVPLSAAWFDADEFVNLQQARGVHAGLALYTDLPSNHPPGYTLLLATFAALTPHLVLLTARLLGALMGWAAGLLLWDLYRREGRDREGRLFLALWSLDAFVLLATSRAMNEAPLLLLLAAALWLLARKATSSTAAALGAGLLLGAAFMVRYTALFYAAPLLLVARRRGIAVACAAVATVSLGLLLFAQTGGDAGALYRDTVAFHGGRAAAPVVERILTALVWAGWPMALYALWLRRAARPPAHRFTWVAVATLGSASLMAALPNTHPHYLLAAAPVTAAIGASLLARAPPAVGQRPWWAGPAAVVALFGMLTVGQAAGYVLMTPHHDARQADRIAAWVGAHSGPGDVVLTDAPEYALLASRGNWHGYYWALRTEWTAAQLEPALAEVQFVVASSRFGTHGGDFPTGFEDRLAGLPCAEVEGAWVFWNTAVSPVPSDFGPACPDGRFIGERGP